MGLLERAGRLGAVLDEAGRAGIAADVERLAGPDAMGKLFKVMAISTVKEPHARLCQRAVTRVFRRSTLRP